MSVWAKLLQSWKAPNGAKRIGTEAPLCLAAKKQAHKTKYLQ